AAVRAGHADVAGAARRPRDRRPDRGRRQGVGRRGDARRAESARAREPPRRGRRGADRRSRRRASLGRADARASHDPGNLSPQVVSRRAVRVRLTWMPSETAAPPGARGDVLDALGDTRTRTLVLVAHLDDETLERVHSPLMSPLVWDLGHIAAFEDLWLAHRGAGLPLLRPDLTDVYDAFETPRAHRGELPYLRRADALDYLRAVHERAFELGTRDPFLLELVLRHEQQHSETMLQTMELAHLPAPPHAPPAEALAGPALSGLELVDVPAGGCTIGAPADGFAYDNERPRHELQLPA